MVGLSGGKDSVVTLDLCCQTFPRVEAYFMYLVPGLRCVETQIDYLERKYKVKVHRLPHWHLAELLKHSVYRPHAVQAATTRKLGLVDFENYLRETTEIEWFAYGHRMAHSLERRGMLTHLHGIDRKAHRTYPIYRWKTSEVFSYLRSKKIPLPPRLTTRENTNMSGIGLEPDSLEYLRDNYPDDYEKVLKIFPYSGAGLAKQEFYGKADK